MILGKQMESLTDLQRMAVGILDSDNFVINMEEKTEKPKSNIAFFATYYYRQDTIPLIKIYLDEGNTPDAPGNFSSWLYPRKPLLAYIFEGECVDIGTPEAYEDVKKNWSHGFTQDESHKR